ncbi:MAG: glycosyltransferase family 4 protein [Prosthecobacter sp.]
MKIAIYANLEASGAGGVQTYLSALIHSLGKLDDGPEEYVIIAEESNMEWIKPVLGANQSVCFIKKMPKSIGGRIFMRLLKWLRNKEKKYCVEYNHRREINLADAEYSISISAGLVESLGVQMIHFPFQTFFLTGVPSLFNPHDLQHLHYPQYFSPAAILQREVNYPFACRLASKIAVASEWIASDLATKYSLQRSKISVIPWGGATAGNQLPTDAIVDEIRLKYDLPVKFVFYPAVTWPHKNHIRLIEAIALLKGQGKEVSLVMCGASGPSNEAVKQKILSLNLEESVRFLGAVQWSELRSLYRAAHAVIVPTLFEAVSGPVSEAWIENVPVACSNIPQLKEQALDAALFFDPLSIVEIANAILTISRDDTVRSSLIAAGKIRASMNTWETTALAYRELYRSIIAESNLVR